MLQQSKENKPKIVLCMMLVLLRKTTIEFQFLHFKKVHNLSYKRYEIDKVLKNQGKAKNVSLEAVFNCFNR